jgi:mannosyltransferase OCH1-like enzyme
MALARDFCCQIFTPFLKLALLSQFWLLSFSLRRVFSHEKIYRLHGSLGLLVALSKYKLSILILPLVFIAINGVGAVRHDFSSLETHDFIALSGREKTLPEKTQNLEDLKFFEQAYLKQLPLLNHVSSSAKIPKIIHFIWVGPSRFPLESIENLKSWKKLHPDWTLKFWSDSFEAPPPVDGIEKHIISELNLFNLSPLVTNATPNYEEINILKCQILYEQGGLCVDHHLKCYQPFDSFHSTYDFYAGLAPPRNKQEEIVVSSCLIGAKPFHPIICFTIEKMKEAGSQFRPISVEKNKLGLQDSMVSIALTQITRSYLGLNDVVFPSSFFYSAQTFSKKSHQILKEKHLVFASNRISYHWEKPTTDKSAKDVFQKIEHVRNSIFYKANLLEVLFYVNSILQIVVVFCLIRIKFWPKKHA